MYCRVKDLLPGTTYAYAITQEMRNRITVSAHTSYGWSNPSKPVSFSTLPDIPTSLSPPTFSLQCADMMSKPLPAYYCNCTLSWEAAKDNGSPITSYLVQVNPTNSNFDRQKEVLLASISNSLESRSELKAGERCRVMESEGWILETGDELVTVLLDNQTAFQRVSKDAVELLPFPIQSLVFLRIFSFDLAEKIALHSLAGFVGFLLHQSIHSSSRRTVQRFLGHHSNRRCAFHNSHRFTFIHSFILRVDFEFTPQYRLFVPRSSCK